MTNAAPVGQVLEAARRRIPLGLLVALVTAAALSFWGVSVGNKYSVTGSVVWGWVPSSHHDFVPGHLDDVNRAERFMNAEAFEAASFGDCSSQALNVGLPTIEVTCSAPAESEARAKATAAVAFVAESFNVFVRRTLAQVETQRDLRVQRVRIAEEAVESLQAYTPTVEETLQLREALLDWRQTLVDARLDLFNFELSVARLREAEPAGEIELVAARRTAGKLAALSVAFGLAMGIFTALAFGAFDALSKGRRHAPGVLT